jgi:predicted DsbA family dithiol-disulfide isomerase
MGGHNMHIDIWLDFTCPFCYLGKVRFEQALKKFKYRKDVTITYKSYLLQPYFTNEENLNSHEFLAKHKDISVEEAINLHQSVAQMAFEDGLLYDFEKQIPASTIQAHKMMKLFDNSDDQSAFIGAIYEAYFSKGEDISLLEVLLKYGLKYGLDQRRIEQAYLSNDNLDLIKQDIDQANLIGVRGVPFFVANQKYGMAGAQPMLAFYEMLEELYYESRPKKVSKTEFCVGEHCERAKK